MQSEVRYQDPVTPPTGARIVLVDSTGHITSIVSGTLTPQGGFSLSYNRVGPTWLIRSFIGNYVEYIVEYQTTFTTVSDWENVTQAVGAGPSLLINGTITADGEAEGFCEDRINVNRSTQSFIGAKADRKILIGNIGSTALKDVVSVCQSLSMVNAMYLDGGGSVRSILSGKRHQAGMSIMHRAAQCLAVHGHSLQSSTPDIRTSRVLPP